MIKLMPIVEQIQQEQLEEAGFKDIALGAAVVASSIFGGAKAQSKIPTDKPAITATSTQSTILPQEKTAWNTFHNWLESKGYAGNDKMNNDIFRQKVLNQYKKETGVNAPDTNFVKKLQQYQIDSRNDIIKNVEAGKASVEYDYKTNGWDGFQDEVLSMKKRGGVDGKIGKETSKYFFRVWKDRETGKLTKTFTIPGEIGKAK
jgi:hypothetical protein